MNDQLRSEVLHRWHGGQSARAIAHELGCARKTVTKVIAEHAQQRAHGVRIESRPRKRRTSLVDAHEAMLRDYLARYPEISVVRLLEELRRHGFGM